MRIALDANGGDHAPAAIVDGVVQAAEHWGDTIFILIGHDEKIVPKKLHNLEFRYASEQIEPDDEPVKAVRRKKDSSMVIGCQMLKAGEADAFISAGNTGALMAAGLLYTGRIKGVSRPALAPIFPTIDGRELLVLDVGANPDAKAEHLFQYAGMGSIYAEKVLGCQQPRVGLLNIGTEEGKGSQLTKEAHELISQCNEIHFVGNTEAREVLHGPCDVLVCDGFSGNILLKNAEGVAKAILGRLKQEILSTWYTRFAGWLLRSKLQQFAKEMDYQEHGGAPLLGIAAPIIKAHGSSDGKAIFHAVRQARLFVSRNVVSLIQDQFAK
ncbi:phosphate:acyl-[acyl carrier protein] acyltransferase [Seinonella peptonophila]|uniref:Phosphate acyltransferase n=1 Tax=Seinonella peptonophila TaxID=112248 RepID=A0A1M4UTY0_9BACL|nr:phosphate acyltransferase PlsX [Seinonella peptonophila]SHE60083.1 phosphate:acyl-[acyl carrier protein] acyltransferase [Seinonella peptonophila]